MRFLLRVCQECILYTRCIGGRLGAAFVFVEGDFDTYSRESSFSGQEYWFIRTDQ